MNKIFFTVLLSLFFILSGCSSTPQKEYTFNNEQIKFLNSLGIYSIEKAIDKGGKVTFDYNKETIEVYLNDSNGITTVKYGKYDADKILWSDKLGKIGLLKYDRKRYLENFIKNAPKRYDQSSQLTYIDFVSSMQLNHKGIYTYMIVKGRDLTNKKYLRAVLHYSDEDWVFFNKVIFSNETETWTYKIPNYFKIRHDVVYGGIHESYALPLKDIIEGLKIVTTGKNPRIDFSGDHLKDGRKLNAYDLQNIRNYLLLYEIVEEDE